MVGTREDPSEESSGLAGEDETEHHRRFGEDESGDDDVGRCPVEAQQRVKQGCDHGLGGATCARERSHGDIFVDVSVEVGYT